MGCSTSRIVHLLCEHGPTDHAAMPPHGFCTATQVFARGGAIFVWLDAIAVARETLQAVKTALNKSA